MNRELLEPHMTRSARTAVMLAIICLALLSGCRSIWYCKDPEPMPNPPEIQHPVKSANDIEFRLQMETRLMAAPDDTLVHLDPAGDWDHPLFAPIWDALLPRLLMRYPKLHFIEGPLPPDCVYQLTLLVESGAAGALARIRLRNPVTGLELWAYSHPLYPPSTSEASQ